MSLPIGFESKGIEHMGHVSMGEIADSMPPVQSVESLTRLLYSQSKQTSPPATPEGSTPETAPQEV